MTDTLVSAIIPTYNRCDVLQNAIESTLNQTYKNLEVIVVDDGSTDNTSDVLLQYSNRIKVVRQPNRGASSARNHGAKISGGEILCFLDSDDTWLPKKIEDQVSILNRYDSSVPCCLTNIKLAYSNGKIGTSFELSLLNTEFEDGLWLNPLQVLSTRFILFNQAVAVRRDAFVKVGGFDESLRYMEDYDFAIRLAMLGPWAYTKTQHVVWNEGSLNSLTGQAKRNKLRLETNILDIYKKANLNSPIYAVTNESKIHLKIGLSQAYIRKLSAEFCAKENRFFSATGKLIQISERIFDKLYTNSPWYPKMKTIYMPETI